MCRPQEDRGLEVGLTQYSLVILGARSSPPALKMYPNHEQVWELLASGGISGQEGQTFWAV